LPPSGDRSKAVMVGVIGRLRVIAWRQRASRRWLRRLFSWWFLLSAQFFPLGVLSAMMSRPIHSRRVALGSAVVWGVIRSGIPAIEMMWVQLTGFNAVEAICVDGGHGRAVGHCAIGEAFNAACLAKQMMDFMLVKKIFSQIVFTGEQREFIPWREGQNWTKFLAARAVSGYRLVEVGIDFVSHRAALAAAVVMLNGHRRTPPEDLGI
jgi:hypothetical protein